ncbi:MAG: PD-(D/E)XK nuclease family protein [Gilvibacter sp.]
MQSFLEETWEHLSQTVPDNTKLRCVLPSIRAGNFLKEIIAKNPSKACFLPEILSIEGFIQQVADLAILDNTPLLFELYEVYLNTFPKEPKESFDSFINWAPTLLGDFNEIDRYLVDPKAFFNYLQSIQDMNHWIMQPEQTPLMIQYLSFWTHLYGYYSAFTEHLINKGVGYQGMVYREAAGQVEHYFNAHQETFHAFIGFNALNNAEQHLFQELLERDQALVYWDAEAHFINNSNHSASHFMRSYFKQWKTYQNAEPLFVTNHYPETKKLNVIESSSAVSQVKHVGTLLSQLTHEELSKTAVVLANEALLVPLLNSLPDNVTQVNVTMGMPFKNIPLGQWYLMLSSLVLEGKTVYYKDVFRVLSHPVSKRLIASSSSVLSKITADNRVQLTIQQIQQYAHESDHEILQLLFSSWKLPGTAFLERITQLLSLEKSQDLVISSAKAKLSQIVESLEVIQTQYPKLQTGDALKVMFVQQLKTASLDFHGDAYKGLQIMGVLETRLLDFERIIMTSVNEGDIPAGKSSPSFITSDLKKAFDLPSYFEKDAVFTYHFYRMLHRATNVDLLYINSQEGIAAKEKSRLILQLENDALPKHTIQHFTLEPVFLNKEILPIVVHKTQMAMQRLQEIATKGFSPSALTGYIRNPIDFYKQRLLKIRPEEGVEETIAYNTLGTIVHESIELLYGNFINQDLEVASLKALFDQITKVVTTSCEKVFSSKHYLIGHNRIIFEVAKQYVRLAIHQDIDLLNKGRKITLLGLEQELDWQLDNTSLPFPVTLRGVIDRVDLLDNQLRIIDYKTGRVTKSDLKLSDWDSLFSEYKFGKGFQVLTYALLYHKNKGVVAQQAGIISFKNMSDGFMGVSLAGELALEGDNVSASLLDTFESYLIKLIEEICNAQVPFTEKEVL